MLWKCGIFSFVLVFCVKTNLATLDRNAISERPTAGPRRRQTRGWSTWFCLDSDHLDRILLGNLFVHIYVLGKFFQMYMHTLKRIALKRKKKSDYLTMCLHTYSRKLTHSNCSKSVSQETRVTRCVCENIAQIVAEASFCQNYYVTFAVVKSGHKSWTSSTVIHK
jgi:hypothetical protein